MLKTYVYLPQLNTNMSITTVQHHLWKLHIDVYCQPQLRYISLTPAKKQNQYKKGKRKRYTPPTYRQLIRKHCLYLQAQFFYIHTKCQHMHRAVIDRQIGKNTAWKRLYMMFCIILWNWVNISLCKAVRGYRYFAVIQYYCYCLTALFASFVNRGGTVRTCRGTLDRLGPFMFHISTTKAK